MAWNIEEAIAYYQRQGAPRDQNALISMLKEIQQNSGGSIPYSALNAVADACGVKDTFLHALIRRIPSLRLGDAHSLQLCAGPNCGRHTALADAAQRLCRECSGKVELKFVPCMRMCGKGPNIRWDGKLYHGATEALLEELLKKM